MSTHTKDVACLSCAREHHKFADQLKNYRERLKKMEQKTTIVLEALRKMEPIYKAWARM